MDYLTSLGLAQHLQAILGASGLADQIGGPEVLREGLAELQRGLALVAVELLAAEAADMPLSEAVFDLTMCPHTARLHGFLRDLLVMDIPAELLPWARKIVQMGPAPDAPEVRLALVHHALRPKNPASAALARFALFEALVINQRLLIMAASTELDVVGGQHQTVEDIADLEVLRATALDDYADDLLDLDDPLPVLVAKAFEQLGAHVEDINRELAWATTAVRKGIETRREILAVLAKLPPADAVLLFNEGGLGVEVLAVEDLQQLHPGLLGGLTRDAVYQRTRRAKAKARRIVSESLDLRRGTSFADLLLSEFRGS